MLPGRLIGTPHVCEVLLHISKSCLHVELMAVVMWLWPPACAAAVAMPPQKFRRGAAAEHSWQTEPLMRRTLRCLLVGWTIIWVGLQLALFRVAVAGVSS